MNVYIQKNTCIHIPIISSSSSRSAGLFPSVSVSVVIVISPPAISYNMRHTTFIICFLQATKIFANSAGLIIS